MIEVARTRAGEVRADAFIVELERRAARGKQDALRRLSDIAIRFEEYAQMGTLRIPLELNQLTDNIWEIKAGDVRLPFFEVPESPSGAVRLTSGFIKGTWRTPRKFIDEAEWVRREDLQS
jgi:hypothetical protein